MGNHAAACAGEDGCGHMEDGDGYPGEVIFVTACTPDHEYTGFKEHGLVDLSRGSQYTGVPGDDPEGELVHLNVYHLNDNWSQSNLISNQLFGIGGAFHAGVEVHGIEWTFGEDGITCGDPRTHQVHVYHESILLGETILSADEVHKVINDMQEEWLGEDYHMLEKNCCNFSDTLSQELVGEAIPAWVTRFPEIACAAAAHLDNVVDVKRLVMPHYDDMSPNSGDISPTKSEATLQLVS